MAYGRLVNRECMALCSGEVTKSGGPPSSAWAACPNPAPLRGSSDLSPWDIRIGSSRVQAPTPPAGLANHADSSSGFQWGSSPVQPGSKPPSPAWEGSVPSPASSQGSTSAPQRRGDRPRRGSPEASGGDGGQDSRQAGNGRRRGHGRGRNGSPQKGQAVHAGQRGERSDMRPPRSVPALVHAWILWQKSGTDSEGAILVKEICSQCLSPYGLWYNWFVLDPCQAYQSESPERL